MEHPEIGHLIQLQKKFNLVVKYHASSNLRSFVRVEFCAGLHSWPIFIDNEYGYLDLDKQLVCIYLALSALEDYKTADDYLTWCKDNELNASEADWLKYYRELGSIYQEVESVIGKIDPFISSYDYELRAGAFSYLLNHD